MSQFEADIAKFVKKANGNADSVVRKVLFDIGTKIVMRSPVGDRERWAVNIERAKRGLAPVPKGYVGGRFRGNWQYSFKNPETGELLDVDPSGRKTTGRLIAGMSSSPAFGLHYIVNNLPYAKRLEDGWSKQAPAGMVTITVKEFQQIVRLATRKTI